MKNPLSYNPTSDQREKEKKLIQKAEKSLQPTLELTCEGKMFLGGLTENSKQNF